MSKSEKSKEGKTLKKFVSDSKLDPIKEERPGESEATQDAAKTAAAQKEFDDFEEISLDEETPKLPKVNKIKMLAPKFKDERQ